MCSPEGQNCGFFRNIQRIFTGKPARRCSPCREKVYTYSMTQLKCIEQEICCLEDETRSLECDIGDAFSCDCTVDCEYIRCSLKTIADKLACIRCDLESAHSCYNPYRDRCEIEFICCLIDRNRNLDILVSDLCMQVDCLACRGNCYPGPCCDRRTACKPGCKKPCCYPCKPTCDPCDPCGTLNCNSCGPRGCNPCGPCGPMSSGPCGPMPCGPCGPMLCGPCGPKSCGPCGPVSCGPCGPVSCGPCGPKLCGPCGPNICGPCGPKSCGPCGPKSCGPCGPTSPCGPCGPSSPCGPCGPSSPCGPCGPSRPGGSCRPNRRLRCGAGCQKPCCLPTRGTSSTDVTSS